MFAEETVFVLGAGASWHYGYPTGEGLIAHVKKRAVWLADQWRSHQGLGEHLRNKIPPKYFIDLDSNDRFNARDLFVKECEKLSDRLNRVNPLVIDYFLDQNPDLQNIGKLLIAHVILECEKRHRKNYANFNHLWDLEQSPDLDIRKKKEAFETRKCKDHWCRFIVDKIISDCPKSQDILRNQLNFVTFNYDVSLEHQMYRAIQPIQHFTEEDKKKLFEREHFVVHPYGQIRSTGFEETDYGDFPEFPLEGFSGSDTPSLDNRFSSLDKAWEAAQTIKTISEAKKQEAKALDLAREKLKNAKRVFILGYGFDKNNNGILQFKECLSAKQKIIFTNFKDSNRVNKRIGLLLWPYEENLFLDRSIPKLNMVGKTQEHYPYEKSVRNVHDALEQDFDL